MLANDDRRSLGVHTTMIAAFWTLTAGRADAMSVIVVCGAVSTSPTSGERRHARTYL